MYLMSMPIWDKASVLCMCCRGTPEGFLDLVASPPLLRLLATNWLIKYDTLI